MPKSPHVFAAGAFAFWAFLAVGAGAQHDASTVPYRGRVVDTIGAPLPGVDVTCTARGGVAYRAKTDDKGEYALASTTGRCERIEFTLEGFVSESFRFPAGVLDVSLNVGSLGQPEPVQLTWRGLVVNADGSPAVDASVWAWQIGGAWADASRTDIDGIFEMPANFAGDFVLCARGAGERQRVACQPFTTLESVPGGKRRLQLPPLAK